MTTEQNTLATTTIPLNKLFPSTANVRRTGKSEDIEALAASIAAHGLRQNLNVLPSADGSRYEVVAGGRRLKAMKQLAKAGQLAKDAPIPCLVLGESDDAAEISLAENAMRTAMHPDDQCEAFRALIEERQATVEEVAARFGVTPTMVRQRLKLAHVSPKLRAIYRKGGMTLDHVMALAISDDHAAQEAAWVALPDWNRSALSLKRALTGNSVPARDRLARFVGIETYIAAGGAVLRDLFDAEDEGYLTDAALVQRLAVEKMDAAAAALKAEGWIWAKAELTHDYATCYGRIYPQVDESDEDENEDGAIVRDFTAEQKARAGARITLDHDGELCIERGLIHPDDVKTARKAEGGARTSAATGLSAPLVAELTAHRTAALRIELARNPSVALAATVHALALPTLYHGAASSCLALRAASEELARHIQAREDGPAHAAMTAEGESWGDRLPGDPDDLFAWCLAQPQDVLLDLLAYVAALTVDAVQVKHRATAGQDHADRLADALSLDMKAWWTPSVEGFWQRLPKAALSQALTEAKVPPLGVAVDKLKKSEAARMVAEALTGSGWLPEVLRTRTPETVQSDA